MEVARRSSCRAQTAGSGSRRAEPPLQQAEYGCFGFREIARLAGRGPRAAGDGLHHRSVEVGVENRRVNVTLPADGLRIPQPLRHRFYRADDVLLRLRVGVDLLEVLQELRREHRAGPCPEIL